MQVKKRWMNSVIATANEMQGQRMPWSRGESLRAVIAARLRTEAVLRRA